MATVAGTGPAGTALVFDGRIWHGTGANITADDRRYGVLTYFCRPWMRPQENYTLSTHPDVVDTLDDELRALLGLRVWRTLGGVEGPWGPGTPEASGFRTDGFVRRRAPHRRAALTGILNCSVRRPTSGRHAEELRETPAASAPGRVKNTSRGCGRPGRSGRRRRRSATR